MYNTIIIGCGNKGALADLDQTQKYLSYAHACIDSTEVELFGITDKDDDKALKVNNIYNTVYFDLNLHKKWLNKIDIIIIATNDDSHWENFCQIKKLKKDGYLPNLKLIICEKPIVTKMYQLIVLEYFKQNKTPILVNYTRRFCKYWQDIKTKILLNQYGEFKKGYLYFNGGWMHTCSHFIDLVNFLGLNKYFKLIDITEVDVNFKWVFSFGLIFENDIVTETIKKDSISEIYNFNTKEVMENAVGYLNGKQGLICNADDAHRAFLGTNYRKDISNGC